MRKMMTPSTFHCSLQEFEGRNKRKEVHSTFRPAFPRGCVSSLGLRNVNIGTEVQIPFSDK
jgi:hypothetical protein